MNKIQLVVFASNNTGNGRRSSREVSFGLQSKSAFAVTVVPFRVPVVSAEMYRLRPP